MPKVEGVQRATGRSRAEWFAELDNWGAAGRPYKEIATWLMAEHGLSRWWAQKLIVEYEQERGIRPPGIRPNGTFEVSASKTVAVPVEKLYDAFVNSRQRKRWLSGPTMSLKSSSRPLSARFDWEDGSTRVSVSFTKKEATRSSVVVAHDRITDAEQAQTTKAMWRMKLVELKSLLES